MDFLQIVNVDLNDKDDIVSFLREHKIPLPKIAICHRKRLYLTSECSLQTVHDPFSGEHVKIDPDMQSFIGSIDKVDDLFHSVFLNNEGGLVVPETSCEMCCEVRPHTRSTWTSAVLDLTFQPENT